MAAEPWKYIEPRWGPWPDGIYQALVVTDEVMVRGQKFGEVFTKMPSYPSMRLSFIVPGPDERGRLFKGMLADLEGVVRPAKVVSRLDIDGLRLQADDGSWVLLRQSGTEYKVRVYGQALAPARLIELLKAVKDLASKVASSVNAKILGLEEAYDLASR